MNLEDKKKLVFDRLEQDPGISAELKKAFGSQINGMNEEEFVFFLESVNDAGKDDNLKETILSLQKTEKFVHNNIMEIAGNFSKKITENQAEEGRDSDKRKTDSILDKIKTL